MCVASQYQCIEVFDIGLPLLGVKPLSSSSVSKCGVRTFHQALSTDIKLSSHVFEMAVNAADLREENDKVLYSLLDIKHLLQYYISDFKRTCSLIFKRETLMSPLVLVGIKFLIVAFIVGWTL